jgi:predicted transcriptional regulator
VKGNHTGIFVKRVFLPILFSCRQMSCKDRQHCQNAEIGQNGKNQDCCKLAPAYELIMWLKKHFGGRKAALGQLGNLESELMERVWHHGELSVRDLHAELAPRLAYTTVMTTMDRLYKKGMLKRRKEGKAFLYVAALSEQEYQEQLAHHLFGMVLHNGKNNGAVLSNFVDAVSDTDEKLLEHLDQLVKAKRRVLRRPE